MLVLLIFDDDWCIRGCYVRDMGDYKIRVLSWDMA